MRERISRSNFQAMQPDESQRCLLQRSSVCCKWPERWNSQRHSMVSFVCESSICKWKIMISPHRCFLLLVEVCPSEKLNDFCEKVHTVLLFATDEVACKEIWNCDVMLWMPSCLRIKNYLIVNFASSFALGFPVYWLQLLRCQWQASSVSVASSFLINSYCMSVKIRITRKNRWRYLVISKSGGGERGHRRSQGGKGATPPKFLENIAILCFEWRFFKQNSVIRLKSSILTPPNFLVWLSHWTWLSRATWIVHYRWRPQNPLILF